jgi:hypothetical protein
MPWCTPGTKIRKNSSASGTLLRDKPMNQGIEEEVQAKGIDHIKQKNCWNVPKSWETAKHRGLWGHPTEKTSKVSLQNIL